MLPFRSIRPAVIYLTKGSRCLEFIFNIFLLLLIFLAQVLRVMVMRDSVKKRGAKPWELLSDAVFINLPSESFHAALHYRDKDIMVFTSQTVYSDTECVFCNLYTQLTHITVHGTLCAHIFSSNKVRFANRTRGKGWTQMPSNQIFLPFQLLHALTCSESINPAENRCEKARALLRLHPLLPTHPLVTERMSGSYRGNFCR